MVWVGFVLCVPFYNTSSVNTNNTFTSNTLKLSLSGTNSVNTYGSIVNTSVNMDVQNLTTQVMPNVFNLTCSGYVPSTNTGTISNLFNLYIDGFTKSGSYSGTVTNAYSLFVTAPNCGANNNLIARFAGSSYNIDIDTVGFISAPNITPNIVQSTFSGNSWSTTSASWTSTTCTASITPKKASSKIKVSFSSILYAAANTIGCVTIMRNSTDLSGSVGNGFTESYINTSIYNPVSLVYVDSPSTTSSVTYMISIRSDPAGGSTTIGGGGTFTVLLLEEIYT